MQNTTITYKKTLKTTDKNNYKKNLEIQNHKIA